MAPTLILIRHAQALHNVNKNYSIHDPPLSDLGHEQCIELAEALKKDEVAQKIDLIITSPMRRTCQTTVEGLGPLVEAKKKEGKEIRIVASASWQETSSKPCDTGSDISIMKQEFPSIDFAQVDPVYPEKASPATNPYRFTRKTVVARGQACLRELYRRPESVIAVVSHAGFLRTAVSNAHYFNADYRIFDYEDRSEEDERSGKAYVLKQWGRTEEGGLGKSWGGYAAITDEDFPPELSEY